MNKKKLLTSNETDASSPGTRPTLQENQVNTTTETINTKIYDTYLPASKTVTTNGSNKPSLKPWFSLFARVKRGQSTFSFFSPRRDIRSKNDNALIIDIGNLDSSLNEIMVSLFETAGGDILAAKPHIHRGVCTHLELVFVNKEKFKLYATRGVENFNKVYYGYIPTDARRSFLSVKIRNVPLGNKEEISYEIQAAFGDVGKIASIRPLLIEGTSYLTDQ